VDGEFNPQYDVGGGNRFGEQPLEYDENIFIEMYNSYWKSITHNDLHILGKFLGRVVAGQSTSCMESWVHSLPPTSFNLTSMILHQMSVNIYSSKQQRHSLEKMKESKQDYRKSKSTFLSSVVINITKELENPKSCSN
jgi:hypothetical protein